MGEIMFWKFDHLNLRFVSSWSETEGSPDIRISDLGA